MKQILSLGRSLLLLSTFFFTTLIQAQKNPQKLNEVRLQILKDPKVAQVIIDEERETPSFISLKGPDKTYSKAQAKSVLTNYLNVRSGVDDLIISREVKGANTFSVVEFHQLYKGIKVEYSRYTALVKDENIQFFHGSWFEVPGTLSIAPRLSKNEALQKATGKINARKYALQEIEELMAKNIGNAILLSALEKEKKEYDPKGELVVIKNFTKEGIAEMKLAYKFDIYAVEPLSRSWVYVNAADGNILLVDPIIKHVDKNSFTSTSVATTVQTRYAGIRQIKTKQISGNDPNSGFIITASNPFEVYTAGTSTYGLIDDSKGGGIETYDLNGVGGLPLSIGPAYSTAKSFTDADNNWTLAEHKRGSLTVENAESENDDFGWDAHWGAGVVYDYWKQNHDRLSFDGKDAKIKSYIHSGIAYDNAFWNGSVMTYGDGSYTATRGTGFRPLTSLDVCAHEIGHGVCTFTANLVYEKESGAMNEGFSDIWAACAEYFAIKNVDGALQTVYKPFYIGEQIAANPAVPLRRMDDPKARNHPDTYGGVNWRNPDCSPDLVNDYCGVHSNSGVLNKWFYLLTVGSGSGSGPDAVYAGVDDGINDKGNSYSVTGLGFALSEKITYLTELMLTSTATFAEARNVSINIAIALSGNPCSDMVKAVTDAWYAVGVGETFVQPCTITYGFIHQPGAHTSEGQPGAGCDAENAVSVPVLLPPNSSATISVTGTATNDLDYTLSTTSLSNSSSSMKVETLQVFVKNDAVVEGDETVVLNLSITNSGANPVNKTFTLIIIEDDVTPILSTGEKTLLNETFTRADGFADPAGWKEILEIKEEPTGTQAAKGKNQWGIFDNKLAITGRDEILGLKLLNSTYNIHSISQTIIQSPYIDARGLNNLKLKFDYTVQGEVDPNSTNPATWPAYDYMSIVYSLDGNNWFEFIEPPFFRFASASPVSGTFEAVIPSFLNNKQFYIGFRWYNDPLVGGPVSVNIDNLLLNGSTRRIENELNHNSRENLNAGFDVYFYSVQDQELVGRVKNNSGKNFGCTNVFVEKTGTGAFNLYQSNKDGLNKVADKVVRIESAISIKASTTIHLYFTEAQLQGLESATAKSRTEFAVYHVNGVAYTSSSSQNTRKYIAAFTPLPGVGGYYTITINEKVNGSFAVGATVSVSGNQSFENTTLMEEATTRYKFHNIYPNPGNGTAAYLIDAPQQQRVRIEVINMFGQVLQTQQVQLQTGRTQINLQLDRFSGGIYMIRVRNEQGQVLNSQSYIKN